MREARYSNLNDKWGFLAAFNGFSFSLRWVVWRLFLWLNFNFFMSVSELCVITMGLMSQTHSFCSCFYIISIIWIGWVTLRTFLICSSSKHKSNLNKCRISTNQWELSSIWLWVKKNLLLKEQLCYFSSLLYFTELLFLLCFLQSLFFCHWFSHPHSSERLPGSSRRQLGSAALPLHGLDGRVHSYSCVNPWRARRATDSSVKHGVFACCGKKNPGFT